MMFVFWLFMFTGRIRFLGPPVPTPASMMSGTNTATAATSPLQGRIVRE